MDDELSPLQQDEAVSAEHHAAVARGEKRVLRTTRNGRLHSYPADEIGFSPGRGQAQVRTWWAMAVLAVVMALLALLAVVILVAPLRNGQGPEWSALFLLALGGFGTCYCGALARDERRAAQVRQERGSPEPGA